MKNPYGRSIEEVWFHPSMIVTPYDMLEEKFQGPGRTFWVRVADYLTGRWSESTSEKVSPETKFLNSLTPERWDILETIVLDIENERSINGEKFEIDSLPVEYYSTERELFKRNMPT